MNNQAKKKIVILGAGIAGLSVGYFLSRTQKYEVTIIEQSNTIGGLCASFFYHGFTLDHGAHKLYSVIPGVLEQIRVLMGDRLVKLPKKNRIYLQGHLLEYPLKLGSLLKAMGLRMFIRLGFGYGVSVARHFFSRQTPRSYEEYMIKCFGKPAYQLVFEPLADKVWGNPSGLHAEMARTRVPSAGGLDIILKLLGLKEETAETNAEYFYYPHRGFGDWPKMLQEKIELNGGEILSDTRIQCFKKQENRVVEVLIGSNGMEQSLPCDYLISSIPLPALSRYIFSQNGKTIEHCVDRLQFRHLILVYVAVKRPLVMEDQWIFFPEKKFIFGRIFEQKQMNPELGPKDQTMICCDLTCEEESWLWKAEDSSLVKECIRGLQEAQLIDPGEVTDSFVKRFRNFYPRYDLEYMEKMKAAGDQLKQIENLILTGRLGMYNYNNSDHCFDMGRFISERLEAGINPKEIWNSLENHVRQYKIVD